jgi:hypothetical protein
VRAEGWGEVAAELLKARRAWLLTGAPCGFGHAAQAGESLLRLWDADPGEAAGGREVAKEVGLVLLPLLRLLAAAADESSGRRVDDAAEGEAEGEGGGRQQEAAQLLQKFFRSSFSDRSLRPSSKKWFTLFIINTLFKLYFRVRLLFSPVSCETH